MKKKEIKLDIFKKAIEKGSVVRAIPAPNTLTKPRKFFDDLNKTKMKEDFRESVNEGCGPEGKKKVKRLAHTLTNIAPDSKVMHKKLHMLCAKLGLSHKQCHALTHREGYT